MTKRGGGWGVGGINILPGLRNILDTRKGGSEKIVGPGGGSEICILQNQQERGGGAPNN